MLCLILCLVTELAAAAAAAELRFLLNNISCDCMSLISLLQVFYANICSECTCDIRYVCSFG